jgi:hypothetical protein
MLCLYLAAESLPTAFQQKQANVYTVLGFERQLEAEVMPFSRSNVSHDAGRWSNK